MSALTDLEFLESIDFSLAPQCTYRAPGQCVRDAKLALVCVSCRASEICCEECAAWIRISFWLHHKVLLCRRCESVSVTFAEGIEVIPL